MIPQSYYGDVSEANAYFANRLHESAWTESSPTDRVKGLIAATSVIDRLAFKGHKSTVYDALVADEEATAETLRAADAEQELQFPRDSDTEVPAGIRRACYEIAYALLDGRDPEAEFENLSVDSSTYGRVTTSYDRNVGPAEHLANGVPSLIAWQLLRPFLRDAQTLRLRRSS